MLCLPRALHLPAGAKPSAQPHHRGRGTSVGSPPGRTMSYPCPLRGTASSSVPISKPASKPLQHSPVCFRSSTSRTQSNYLPYCSISWSSPSPASKILTSAWGAHPQPTSDPSSPAPVLPSCIPHPAKIVLLWHLHLPEKPKSSLAMKCQDHDLFHPHFSHFPVLPLLRQSPL